MLVKTRLHINVAVSVLTSFVIVLVLLLALYYISHALEESDIAGQMITTAFERSTLRSDYQRTDSERAKRQWFAKHEEMSRLLKAASEKFKNAEDKKTIEVLIKDHDATGKLFSGIVENREKAKSDPDLAAFSQETERRLVSQLEISLYDKVSNARKLDEAAGRRLLSALRLAGGVIISVLAIVTGAAILNSWTMARNITNRIGRLRHGTLVIGEGNLGHRIDIEGNDEFAELSAAFNAMGARLRESYIELENEIAERERGEDELRQSEQRLNRAQEISHVGSWELDVINNILTWSDEVYRIFGFTPQEFGATYEAFLEAVHPDDRAAVDAAYSGSLREGRDTYNIEHRVVRRSTDEVRYVHEKCEHIKDETGRVIRSVGMAHDITELRQAQSALRFTQFAVDRSLDQAFWMTQDGRFFYVNDAACRALGYSREELVKLSVTDIDPEFSPEIFARHWGAIQEKGSGTFESHHRAKDGHLYPVEIRANHVTFDGKEYDCAFVTDITERKRAEEALQKANDELEIRVGERTAELEESRAKMKLQYEELQHTYQELQTITAERIQAIEQLREKDRMMIQQSRMAAMGEMLGYIAHQWRQPLNVLGLTIQDLGLSYECGEFSKELLDASIRREMDIILHLSQTIDDFSNFAVPDKEKRQFRVDEVISRTLSLVQESFISQSIKIETDTAKNLQINGYANEFAQVLLNIIINARDAFLERGTTNAQIKVRSWSEQDRAIVSITDNAGGIPEEILGKIFDAYFTTKELGKGSGVGLFMSKTIIEKNMGGHLTVRNTDNGAEFRIEV